MIESIINDPNREKKNNVKRYNNYSLAIILGLIAAVGVTLALILTTHLASGSMPEWLYELLCAIFGVLCVSQIISGTGYLFTGFDILFKERTGLQAAQEKTLLQNVRDRKLINGEEQKGRLLPKFFNFIRARKVEFIGLTVGFLTAVGITIYMLLQGAGSIFASALPGVGAVIFFITNVSFISGLCSRLGRCIDFFRINPTKNEQRLARTRKRLAKNHQERQELGKPDIFRGENINYVLGVIAGIILGGLIAGLCLGFAGVTTVMTAGGALPLWMGGLIFAVGAISSCASACGYIGRVFDFLLGERTLWMKNSPYYIRHAETEIQRVSAQNTIHKEVAVYQDKNYFAGLRRRAESAERIGTVIGVSAGIVLGIVLIVTGLAAAPFLGMGLPAAAAGVIVMLTCIGGVGGLGNRIGFFIDRLKKRRTDAEHIRSDNAALKNGQKDKSVTLEPREGKGLLSAPSRDDLLSQDADVGRDNAAFAERIRAEFGNNGSSSDEGSDESVKKNLDSGRRESDTTNVRFRVDAGWLPNFARARCTFFAKTTRETISGFDTPGLDASGDEWSRLREKAQNGQNDPTYTYYYVDGTGGRGKQNKGFGIRGRLCDQTVIAERIDRPDQDGFATRAAAPAA